MNTTAFVIEQPYLENIPSGRSGFGRQGFGATHLGRSADRSGLSNRGRQPLLVATGADRSFSFRSEAVALAESELGPFKGFADVLHSLYVSGRFGLSTKLCQRLVELLALQSGWDGEGASPPKPEVLAQTVGLLVFCKTTVPGFQEPFLVPTIDGFAQLEWHTERRTLEFEATATGWSIVGCETTPRGSRAYYEAEAARFEIDKLISCYRWFHRVELLWPLL